MAPPEPGTWVDWTGIPAHCACVWTTEWPRERARNVIAIGLPPGTWRYVAPAGHCPAHAGEVTPCLPATAA